MDKNKDTFLAQLLVYEYEQGKIKCDYSVIPIEINKATNLALSGVSNEIIFLNNFNFNVYRPMVVAQEISKQKKARKLSVVYELSDLETQEKLIKKDLVNTFKKSFLFSRRYKNFLDKKVKLGQL